MLFNVSDNSYHSHGYTFDHWLYGFMQHLYSSFEEEPGYFQFATSITSNDLEEITLFLEAAVNGRWHVTFFLGYNHPPFSLCMAIENTCLKCIFVNVVSMSNFLFTILAWFRELEMFENYFRLTNVVNSMLAADHICLPYKSIVGLKVKIA